MYGNVRRIIKVWSTEKLISRKEIIQPIYNNKLPFNLCTTKIIDCKKNHLEETNVIKYANVIFMNTILYVKVEW